MKNTLFLLLIITLLSSCKTITGNGNFTTQNHGSFNNYQKLVIGKMITVNIAAATAGNEKSVTVSTDKNLHEYINVKEKNNTLYIDVKKGYTLETDKLNVNVFTPQSLILVNKKSSNINIDGLEYLDILLQNEGSGKIIGDAHGAETTVNQSGSGSIEFSGIENKPLNIKNSGSGNVVIDGIRIEGANLHNSGSGHITLKGFSADLYISNSGSGDVKSTELSTGSVSVNNSGSGDCFINVNGELLVKISGSGDVKYKGTPIKITKEITGTGKLIKL